MMELERHDYNALLKWKNKKDHLPILLRGLRQIGKSHLAERFAKEQYGEEYCPVLDFRHNEALESLFKDEKGKKKIEVSHIIEGLKVMFPDKKIVKGKTCIVMDEVGDCPLARESFKVFGKDSGYDIIATGSLLGLSQLNGQASDTPIGYEEYLDMTPLNFIEFLENSKVSKEAIDKIFEATSNKSELPSAYHEVLSSHLHRYLIVGGMPEAVSHYLDTGNLSETRDILIRLRKDFEDDFGKKNNTSGELIIDPTLLVRTIRAYRSIPDQLAKENKKFKYSAIEGGGRSSQFSDAIAWLEKTNIVALSHNVRAIETPLEGNAITEEFKVYPTDIGLLLSGYPSSIVQQILSGDIGAYKGVIYEGFAADAFYKQHLPLYYYSDTKKHYENDFLLETKNGIVVIESKATNGKMASAKALMMEDSPYKVSKVYKVASSNFGQGSFYETIPQYILPFLLNLFAKEMDEPVILKPLPPI